ncbi:MAG: hypothetical protein ACPG47_09825 [Leucothrix sp.]
MLTDPPIAKAPATAAFNHGVLDLSDYIIPSLDKKDTPQAAYFFKYNQTDHKQWQCHNPVLFERHIWTEKQLLNAPGAERLYLYSVRDRLGKLKQINNYYSIYPERIKSAPSLVIAGTLSAAWEYQRFIHLGKSYPFINSSQRAVTVEATQILPTFNPLSNTTTHTDVIELVYRIDQVIARKAYFAKHQGLVSLITSEYMLAS